MILKFSIIGLLLLTGCSYAPKQVEYPKFEKVKKFKVHGKYVKVNGKEMALITFKHKQDIVSELINSKHKANMCIDILNSIGK